MIIYRIDADMHFIRNIIAIIAPAYQNQNLLFTFG